MLFIFEKQLKKFVYIFKIQPDIGLSFFLGDEYFGEWAIEWVEEEKEFISGYSSCALKPKDVNDGLEISFIGALRQSQTSRV